MHAIYSLHLDVLSRSRKRNVVQMASYVSGVPMTDEKSGQSFSRRDTESDITHGLIGSALSSERIFGMAEFAEKRRDSVVGRHINAALPRGLGHEKEMQIIVRFAAHLSELLRVPVLWARHLTADKRKPDNPHAHFVFPSRPWDEALIRFAKKKDRLLDSRETGSHAIEKIRKAWQDIVNEILPPEYNRIDRRSHVRRGTRRHAKRHLGRHVAEWKRRNRGKKHPSEQFNEWIERAAEISQEIVECDREIQSVGRLIADESQASIETASALRKMELEAEELLRPPSARVELSPQKPAVSPSSIPVHDHAGHQSEENDDVLMPMSVRRNHEQRLMEEKIAALALTEPVTASTSRRKAQEATAAQPKSHDVRWG